MIAHRKSGCQEIEHTADWELQVWSIDLPGLLEQAASGMYALAGVHLDVTHRQTRQFKLDARDPERLLVAFLSELLWLGVQESLGFDTFELSIQADTLDAKVTGSKIISQSKEIKAVTFHDLAIRSSKKGLKVNIVFDV